MGVCEYVCIVSNVRMCTACRHACIGHNGYVIVLNVHFLMRVNKPGNSCPDSCIFFSCIHILFCTCGHVCIGHYGYVIVLECSICTRGHPFI